MTAVSRYHMAMQPGYDPLYKVRGVRREDLGHGRDSTKGVLAVRCRGYQWKIGEEVPYQEMVLTGADIVICALTGKLTIRDSQI